MPAEDALARLRAQHGDEPSPQTLARRRLAAEVRAVQELALDPLADAGALDDLTERLAVARRAATLTPPASRYAPSSDGPGMHHLMNETHPIGGLGNPLASPFSPRFDDGRITADLRFGPAFEGTPGLVHGGFVAATFDHLLGGAAILSGEPIVTGSLTIRYRKPTPLHVELRMECWPGAREGRRVHTYGHLLLGDAVLVEAEAVFVTVDAARYTPPPAAPSGTTS